MTAAYPAPARAATVHFCDPAAMDHPLHRLVGMRRAGWWVLTRWGCLVDVYGPYATHKAAEDHREVWLRMR
jgi:hypothetical protein